MPENSKDVNILGMRWLTDIDAIMCKSKNLLVDNSVITKRVVMQNMSNVFDPLGLVSPVTFRATISVQSLWKDSYVWDTPLPYGRYVISGMISPEILKISLEFAYHVVIS